MHFKLYLDIFLFIFKDSFRLISKIIENVTEVSLRRFCLKNNRHSNTHTHTYKHIHKHTVLSTFNIFIYRYIHLSMIFFSPFFYQLLPWVHLGGFYFWRQLFSLSQSFIGKCAISFGRKIFFCRTPQAPGHNLLLLQSVHLSIKQWIPLSLSLSLSLFLSLYLLLSIYTLLYLMY